jgi:hypothetical protein
MTVGTQSSTRRFSRLQCGVAALFLLFAFADLATSGPCCEGLLERSGSNAVAADAVDLVIEADCAAPAAHDRRAPARHESACEDCFCCSMQTLPATTFAAEASARPTLRTELARLAFLASPPDAPDHPPRPV